MSKFTPEIDALLWAVAEAGNPQSVLEFEARYPQYRLELFRRLAMVKDLRGGKAPQTSSHIPLFVPKEAKPFVSSRAVFAAGTLILAAVGLASYTVSTALWPAAKRNSEPKLERPVAIRFDSPLRKPELPIEKPKPDAPPAVPLHPDTQGAEVPAYLRPQDLKIARASLSDALRLIAQQGGLNLVLAPGMPNPDIAVEYHQQSVIEMLQDLGKQYAFSAFDQHDGSVVIIPAVDESQISPYKPDGGDHSNRRIGN